MTSRPSKLTTVICRATLRAVGLKELEISQRRSSVSTVDSAIVEEKVSVAMRRARCCVGGSSRLDVAGAGSLFPDFEAGCSLCARSKGYTLR